MIFLPYNVPSSKNSKVATSRGVFHSKQVTLYLRKLGVKSFSASKHQYENYKTRPNKFKEFVDTEFLPMVHGVQHPILLGFHFVRDSNRDYDFHNAVQIVLDLLTAHSAIPDDSVKYTLPVPFSIEGHYSTVDKTKPGVYLTLIKEITL